MTTVKTFDGWVVCEENFLRLMLRRVKFYTLEDAGWPLTAMSG
jgi:hypothetical protein